MNIGETKIEIMFNRDGIDGTFILPLAPDWRMQEHLNAVVTMRFPLGAYSTELRVNPALFEDDFTAVVDAAIRACVRSYEKKTAKTTK